MYYQKEPAELYDALHSGPTGLSVNRLASARAEYGYNELPKNQTPWWVHLGRQFHDIMVYILIGAFILAALTPFFEDGPLHLASFLDAIVILAILVLNALLGFVQEYKAEAAIALLEKLTAPQVRVRRGGQEAIIASRELLPGDIVIVEAGDKISADGRIITAAHCRVNESSLTGESVAVDKTATSITAKVPLAEQHNMLFAGTTVTRGSAEYLVTAIALNTEIGKIAALVAQTTLPETPLQKRMKKLGELLGAVVIALCVLVVTVGIWQGQGLIHIFLIGISLAVSAVPEGLPAVVTVCLAMGVRRMVKKNALVRRLDALETLGSVTVICSDKTGTITQNHMSVVDTWVPREIDEPVLFQIAASCNRAVLPDIGDPTEIGLLEGAELRDIDRLAIDEEEVPFTSEAKYMQTRHGELSFIKGATEVVIGLCNQVDRAAAEAANEAFANQGLRVLACALKEADQVRLVGLIAMEDPPRKTAKHSIAQAQAAGIRSVMITGDNLKTAIAIAKQVGITGDAIEGKELDKLTDDALKKHVNTISVYARVSPEHKLRILQALQANHEVVAMSGDGVNDAPALKGAHVGVAMGKVGTEVAREASSIVLADDHFSTIVAAIREGRRIYDNIRKFVLFLLRANFDELLFIITTLILGLPLPYLPIHILLINLMTDGLPALALGMEEAEPDIMNRPPRPQSEHLLAGEFGRLIIAAMLGFSVSMIFYLYLLNQNLPLSEVRAATATLGIMFELVMVFSIRTKLPIWQAGVTSNRWLLGAVSVPFVCLLIMLYTPVAKIVHFSPLSGVEWLEVVGFSVAGLMVFEGLKLLPDRDRCLA